LRLKSNEHDFIERKPRNQKGDWLQAAVAFANSTPIGWPAVLFVGADDAGKPQCEPDQLETLMQSVSDVLSKAYPPIYRHIVPLNVPGEGSCLAVIIPGSADRPHFAGQSYVRVGDQTRVASESQFAELIAQRNGKARMILDWAGKEVTWINRTLQAGVYREGTGSAAMWVEGCNPHFCTIRETPGHGEVEIKSYPLNALELSFDHVRKRLLIYRHHDR
jgi:hypothetical protein